MLNDLSIKNKLILGLGAIVSIMLFLLALAYNNSQKLADANKWDRHALEVLVESNHVATSVLQVQSAIRGFLLTGNEGLIAPLNAEFAEAKRHLATATRLTADNPLQHDRIRQLAPMLDEWMAQAVLPQISLRRARDAGAKAADTATTDAAVLGGARTVAAIRKQIDEIAAEENRLIGLRSQQSAALQENMSLLLTLGGAVTIALAVLIAWLLIRALLAPLNSLNHTLGRIAAGDQSARARIDSNDELGKVAREFNRMAQAIQDSQAKELAATTDLRDKVDALLAVVSRAAAGDLGGRISIDGKDAIGQLGQGLSTMFDTLRSHLNNVQKAGIQVTTSATEIAASSKQQEATGIEQAQTSVEILSTTREISANTTQLLRTMEQATAVADFTTSATAEAQGNLKRMDATMQHMVSATDSINAKLAALSEKAGNINSVLVTITKVADQTNILSLNAAIEAEKAGDAGRGFSVVATEIRRLADQTSISTWDIEQMVKEMQSAVSASVMGMDKFSEEIRRSVGEVRQVAEQLSSVMDQVQKLAPQFDLVLEGMQSQAVGASQISETMLQLSDATQQTVESLKATSEAVRQLQYAAGDLQSSVATFSVNS
ncbi:methyl-accepting chemotaxis protein [Telluria aromaticivorans]|uniref:HAMP domain-containing protein n=1 Tax=Telluria aromaticivorans TaxID=2725995 RepID=A0A7Y2NZE2_9BURK|nr:methyl-accepting chemotaxis protein [Telluria aromaticivorans]NNG22391.1 HAMP domain-containing protein [Telluria aromaticivorans]